MPLTLPAIAIPSPPRNPRGWPVLLALAATLAMAGCGGGGDDASSNRVFDVGAVVNGQPFPTLFYPGQPGSISILVGQSIELDATEPVVWSFSVNGSPLFRSGTTVIYQGVSVTQSFINASRVVIDTALVGPALLPVFLNGALAFSPSAGAGLLGRRQHHSIGRTLSGHAGHGHRAVQGRSRAGPGSDQGSGKGIET